MKLLLLFLTALTSTAPSQTYTSKNNTHFLAAVVEYTPEYDSNLSAATNVMNNVRQYEELISIAKIQGVDIIVFPEVGLTGVPFTPEKEFYSQVPNPRDSVTPCLDPTQWEAPIFRLSCAALSNKIYVVVNLYEQNGSKRHNTNVVFDRDGVVISRYRKLHLFNEPEMQVPDEKEISTFRTDFGVTFGVVICFDMLFREPSLELVHTQNIRHFVISTAWFSEFPFLSAVQTQAAWSWSHDSVLLASGLNSPQYGCTGSGIYAGRKGMVKAIFTGQRKTQLLIGRVPKDLSVNDDSCAAPVEADKKDFESIAAGNLELLKDFLHAFSTELLPTEVLEGSGENDITLCHGEFCCDFEISKELLHPKEEGESTLSGTDWQQYRVFVWNGVRNYAGAATGGVQLCGVVACANATDVKSCGAPVPLKQSPRQVRFSKLQIRGAFESNNSMILANTLNRYMLPLSSSAFDLTETGQCGQSGDAKCMNMTLLRKEDELATFAIYNRVFGRDNSNYTHTDDD